MGRKTTFVGQHWSAIHTFLLVSWNFGNSRKTLDIISPSAAHCVHNKFSSPILTTSNTRIYIGRTNFSNPNENFEIRSASDILIHPNWEFFQDSFDADIAIITLSRKVAFSRFIKPACLPYSSIDVFRFTGTIAGYGLTENSITRSSEKSIKHVKIPTVTQGKCFLDYPEYARLGSERTFCGGEKGKIPCKWVFELILILKKSLQFF